MGKVILNGVEYVDSDTFIKGDVEPSSSLGSDGQIYLRTMRGEKVDLSTFGMLYESSNVMGITKSEDSIVFQYKGGSNIDAQVYKQVDLTDIDEVRITVKTTPPSYNDYATDRFRPCLIIENTTNPASSYIANTSMVSANGETYRVNTQGDIVTFEADVSSLIGNYWIVLSCLGDTAEWTDLFLGSSASDTIVAKAYAKVNGAWQDLIGTDVNDVL